MLLMMEHIVRQQRRMLRVGRPGLLELRMLGLLELRILGLLELRMLVR